MTDTEAPAAEPVHYPDVRAMQQRIVGHAIHGERVFERLLTTTTKFTPAQAETNLLAHRACLYGYALASVLGLLAEKAPDLAADVAWMVDDMGMNGGAEWIDDAVFKAAEEQLGDLGKVEPAAKSEGGE